MCCLIIQPISSVVCEQNSIHFFENMEPEEKPTEQIPNEDKKVQKKKNYRKDKPWDGDHIDHWKIEVRYFSWKISLRNGKMMI